MLLKVALLLMAASIITYSEAEMTPVINLLDFATVTSRDYGGNGTQNRRRLLKMYL